MGPAGARNCLLPAGNECLIDTDLIRDVVVVEAVPPSPVAAAVSYARRGNEACVI